MIFYLILFLLALFMSFYFSGSEAGFVSFNKEKFASDLEMENKNALKIKKYVQNLGLVLAITLLGNNLFNIIAITSLNRVWSAWYYNYLEYFLLISTIIILIFGEILPKNIFRKWSRPILYETSFILIVFHKIFGPLIFVILKISNFFFKDDNNQQPLAKEDFYLLIEDEVKEGTIKNVEKEIITNVSLFSNFTIQQLMTPLVDLYLVLENQNVTTLTESMKKEKIDFVLVYQKRIDHLIGYFTIFDIFNLKKKNLTAKDLLKEAYYVPENISIEKIYQLLIEHNQELLVVVNEKGGSLGVISREEVVNKVFGVKPHHANGKLDNLIQKHNGGYRVNASIDLDFFNDFFKTSFKKNNFETLNGFLMLLEGRVPAPGETIEYQGFIFKIAKTNKISIISVDLKIKEK